MLSENVVENEVRIVLKEKKGEKFVLPRHFMFLS